MAQRTVLELIQDIITETGGDAINSISDTIEATDVGAILKQVYSEIVDMYDLPSTHTVMPLTGLANTAKPNIMQIPEGVSDIRWIKYDVRTEFAGNINYQTITYMDPLEFMDRVTSGPSTDTTNYQIVMWDANTPMIIDKTRGAQFWTSFDDKYIVFDAYNFSIDATMQTSKSMIYAENRPTLTISDSSVPELPANLENLLYIKTLNRVLGTDNRGNPILARQEQHTEVRTQRNKWRQGRQTFNDNQFGRK